MMSGYFLLNPVTIRDRLIHNRLIINSGMTLIHMSSI